MIRYFITLIFTLNTLMVLAQTHSGIQKQITGEVIGKPPGTDTLYFTHGSIDDKYYENGLPSAELTGNRYVVTNNLPYPQMYRVLFASDKGKLAFRMGFYFTDATTTSIKTNYSSDNCSEINGSTASEYQNKFIPFMTSGIAYDCKSKSMDMLYDDLGKKADTSLLNYTIQNPGSYVALWQLIEQFNDHGQSAVRQKTLTSFSNRIKSEKPWKILNKDFEDSKIKENEKFPDINLKNYDLSATKFIVPKAKYTLIDYWFARCRPCLDTIPELQKLYSAYKTKGFDIVSISVDETKNVLIWQKRVKEHGLVWTQYLEENNFQHNELGIKLFPTFILLDKEGRVIWKDFDLHDLDKFLVKNL